MTSTCTCISNSSSDVDAQEFVHSAVNFISLWTHISMPTKTFLKEILEQFFKLCKKELSRTSSFGSQAIQNKFLKFLAGTELPDVGNEVLRQEISVFIERAFSENDSFILKMTVRQFEWLLKCGVHPNRPDYYTAATPLHQIVENTPDLQKISLLLDYGADMNARDVSYRQPIHVAGNSEVARFLIEKGARPNARNKVGRTALHQYDLSVNTVQTFISLGADFRSRDANGNRPIHFATNAQTFSLLRQMSEDLPCSEVNFYGQTPLMVMTAEKKNQGSELMEFSDMRVADVYGNSFIHYACIHYSVKTMLDLERHFPIISAKLNLQVENRSGLSALALFMVFSLANEPYQTYRHLLRIMWIKLNHVFRRIENQIKALIEPNIRELIDQQNISKLAITEFCKHELERDSNGRTVWHYFAMESLYTRDRNFEHFKGRVAERVDDVTAIDCYGLKPRNYASCMLVSNSYRTLSGVCCIQAKLDLSADEIPSLEKSRRHTITTKINKKEFADEVRRRLIRSNGSWKSLAKSSLLSAVHTNDELHEIADALAKHVYAFIDRICASIFEEDERFQCVPIPVGSSCEGTHVGFTREYDFMFGLMRFADLVQVSSEDECPAGFVILTRKSPEANVGTFGEFFENNRLLWRKVHARFNALLTSVLMKSSLWSDSVFSWWDITKLYQLNQDKDMSPNIQVNLLVTNFQHRGQLILLDIELSIDVVPAIHLLNYNPEGFVEKLAAFPAIADRAKSLVNLYGVSGPTTHETIREEADLKILCLVRVTFATVECQIIRTSPIECRTAYKVSKYLAKNLEYPIFKSYHVKMAVIHTLYTCSQLNLTTIDYCKLIWKKLLEFLADDAVPSFFEPRLLVPFWSYEYRAHESRDWLEQLAISWHLTPADSGQVPIRTVPQVLQQMRHCLFVFLVCWMFIYEEQPPKTSLKWPTWVKMAFKLTTFS